MSESWRPSAERGAAMRRWFEQVAATDYPTAHAASVADVAGFWRWAWDECGIVGDPGGRALVGDDVQHARFFPDAVLNVVDTLLAGEPDVEVLVGIDETGTRRAWTRGRLRAQVAGAADAMRQMGIAPGDRVAAWAPNVPEVAIWALAALSIGAVVSTASPDFAPEGVIDRFGQIDPRLLLVGSVYRYGGRVFDMRSSLSEVLAGLPSVETVVVIGESVDATDNASIESWRTWIDRDVALSPTPLAFDHPGFILFSSGTTGAPKCIVHSAAGVLIKDVVEQRIHLDIAAGDRVTYYTTCGWMMWNWLVMALGSGATIVLYDGQPLYPTPDRLLEIAREEELTFLGVSAKYIESLRQNAVRASAPLRLRTIASTGAPLAAELFDYVYANISPDAHLASISGGTDICGCFVLGVPTSPVHRGEIQGAALGLDVQAFADDGSPLPPGRRGELVCTTPFPSRPLGLWGDDGSRFSAAYFDRFPGVWAHGDYVSRTESGGFVIHGRSDATLNSGGVRIGTAEIYRIVDSLPQVLESVAVDQRCGLDTRIVLFVVMAPGAELDDDMRAAIRQELRRRGSPRHVPSEVVAVSAVPRTLTGKVAELAVRDAVNGDPMRSTSGLANAECLDEFVRWAKDVG